MSHFTVLVPAKDEEELKAKLQPYHEYECTGIDDEYVIELDITEEVREDWEKVHEDLFWKGPDGEIHYRYGTSASLTRTPTEDELKKIGFGGHGNAGNFSYCTVYRSSVADGTPDGQRFLNTLARMREDGELDNPAIRYHEGEASSIVQVNLNHKELRERGFEKLNISHKDAGYCTFEEFGEKWSSHKYDHERGGYFRKTNPNSKWDWWSIGGRWSGTLIVKEKNILQGHGEVGAFNKPLTEEEKSTTADWCNVGDLDIDAMVNEAKARAQMKYETYHRVENGKKSGEMTDEDARTALWDAGLLLMTKTEVKDFETLSLHEYVEKNGELKAITFGFIDMEGKWHERGNMGWWGIVSNNDDEYDKAFWDFISTLPDNQRVYVVDCHV